MTKRLLIPIPLAIWLAGCGEAPHEKVRRLFGARRRRVHSHGGHRDVAFDL